VRLYGGAFVLKQRRGNKVPLLADVYCACGRIQRIHVHEPMAYAQACVDCVSRQTMVGGCPHGRYSLN
jgi:hypothetical protein